MTNATFTSAEIAAYYQTRLPGFNRRGHEWRGPCPIHHGTHDSFAVNANTGQWYCHSECARGGSLFDLEMALNGTDFPAAEAEVRRIIGRTHSEPEAKWGLPRWQFDHLQRRIAETEAERGWHHIATYPYFETSGVLRYVKARFLDKQNDKTFLQWAVTPKGGWVTRKKAGAGPLLYGLNTIAAADEVYVLNGEKAVDRAVTALGIVATCGPDGEGHWEPDYTQALAGKLVRIVPDNDEKGKEHGQIVAGALAGNARDVKIVHLPNLPAKGDLFDWIEAGGTREQLDEIVKQAGGFAVPLDAPVQHGTDGLTPELAKAITAETQFARDPGGRLYCFENGVYRPAGNLAVHRRVKALCESWGKTKSWSPELATRVEEWIRVDAPELWECPPLDTLNCRNGLLDIKTRNLGPHSPKHLSPVQITPAFNPTATCPHIEKFVRDVFPADTQSLPFEIVGWLMLADTSIQKAILLLGEGANGKSVYLNLLGTFLGGENVSTLNLHRIEADKFAAARLVGKLCNIGPDLPTAALAGTSMFKALTGGDAITAERKFESSFEFRPFARMLFSANTPPRSDDATHGFFRRWVVIPFNRTFDESDPDTVPRAVLDARLSDPAELSGLLNRALDALPVIRQGHFTESASTRAAFDEFRRTTDPLAVWLDENTVERSGAFIPKDELRRAYSQACHDNGRPIMPENQFTAALQRLRPKLKPAQRRINGKPTRVFVGLGLTAMEQEDQAA